MIKIAQNLFSDDNILIHNESGGDPYSQVTLCGDSSFCCFTGWAGKHCCDNGQGVWIVNGSTTDVRPTTLSHVVSTPSLLLTNSTDSTTFPYTLSTSSPLPTSFMGSTTQDLFGLTTVFLTPITVATTISTAKYVTSPVASSPSSKAGSIAGAVVDGLGGIFVVALISWLLIRRGKTTTLRSTDENPAILDTRDFQCWDGRDVELNGTGRPSELELTQTLELGGRERLELDEQGRIELDEQKRQAVI